MRDDRSVEDLFTKVEELRTRIFGLAASVGALFIAVKYLVFTSTLSRFVTIPLTVTLGGIAYAVFKALAIEISRRARPGFPGGKIFAGVYAQSSEPADPRYQFDRSVELRELEDRVVGVGKSRVVVVTGHSGAGKTTLVRLLASSLSARREFAEGVQSLSFSNEHPTVLTNLVKTLRSRSVRSIESGGSSTKSVIILDQIEMLLDFLTSAREDLEPSTRAPSLRSPTSQAMADLLTMAESSESVVLVLIVRSDRYYDLRHFGKAIPSPSDAFELRGVREGPGMDSLSNAFARLNFRQSEISGLLEELREPDGTILPVQAQIVGCMLEREVFTLSNPVGNVLRGSDRRLEHPRGQLTLDRFRTLNGVAGLVEAYFRLVVSAAPNAGIAKELLFLLSIEGRVGRRYSVATLSALTYRSEAAILETLRSFSTAGLVSVSQGEYALSHDYLADSYLRLSGRLLLPAVRDNLSIAHALRGSERLAPAAQRFDVRKYLMIAIKLVVFAFFGLRLVEFQAFPLARAGTLVGFPYAPNLGLPFASYATAANWSIDWHYLPLAIVQCCWAVYVLDLVGNVFLRIEEGFIMRWLSVALVVTVLVGMVWTAFVPGMWLVWVGIIGIVVGFKFLAIGRRLKVFAGNANRYSLIGFYTLINCGFCVYVGSVVYPYLRWDLPSTSVRWPEVAQSWIRLAPPYEHLYIYYAVVPLLIYFVYMYRAHARPSRAIEFIGLFGRVPQSKREPND